MIAAAIAKISEYGKKFIVSKILCARIIAESPAKIPDEVIPT